MSASHEESYGRSDEDALGEATRATAMVDEYLVAVRIQEGKVAESDSDALYWIDVLQAECKASPALMKEVRAYIKGPKASESAAVATALAKLDSALDAPKSIPPPDPIAAFAALVEDPKALISLLNVALRKPAPVAEAPTDPDDNPRPRGKGSSV